MQGVWRASAAGHVYHTCLVKTPHNRAALRGFPTPRSVTAQCWLGPAPGGGFISERLENTTSWDSTYPGGPVLTSAGTPQPQLSPGDLSLPRSKFAGTSPLHPREAPFSEGNSPIRKRAIPSLLGLTFFSFFSPKGGKYTPK